RRSEALAREKLREEREYIARVACCLWLMIQQTVDASGTQKVRRGRLGGKRAPGHEWQKKQKRVRRADARRLRQGPDDSSLSGVGAEPSPLFWSSAGGSNLKI